VVSPLNAAKYASVIKSVPSKPQNTDTHISDHSDDLEIFFIFFHPQSKNGESNKAQASHPRIKLLFLYIYFISYVILINTLSNSSVTSFIAELITSIHHSRKAI